MSATATDDANADIASDWIWTIAHGVGWYITDRKWEIGVIVLGVVVYFLYQWWRENRNSQGNEPPGEINPGNRKKHRKKKKKSKDPSVGEIEPPAEGLVAVIAKTRDELMVSETVFDRGSDGTILLEGNLGKRSVVVKRLLTRNYQLAMNEMRTLIRADEHPNIVRYHALHRNDEFTFLSLERCTCNLRDVITATPNDPNYIDGLWGTTFLSPKLLTLLRDIVSGLEHLHKLGIIHRDLRPENILISIGNDSFRAKISGMGICKQLPEDQSSVSSTSIGAVGWQPPEQISHSTHQKCSMDLFSLGCIIYYCVSQGSHPFGEPLNREVNIMNNNYDLSSVVRFPEALDLISNLLGPKPTERPRASKVLLHPMFWDSWKRLSFLVDASDTLDVRGTRRVILRDLEHNRISSDWTKEIDPALYQSGTAFRPYNGRSNQHLLRFIRNKHNHYETLGAATKQLFEGNLNLIPPHKGYDEYFRGIFPTLLLLVYDVMVKHYSGIPRFQMYFE